MKELGLGIALITSLIGGLEGVARVSGYLAASLAQAEHLEDLLDLDLDLGFDLDFSTELDSDKVNPPMGVSDRVEK